MKQLWVILCLLCSSTHGYSQSFSSVVVKANSFNEPPARHAPPVYQIEYTKHPEGHFEAKYYTVTQKKIKGVNLKKIVQIPKTAIETFIQWNEEARLDFQLEDFAINSDVLNQRRKSTRYRPVFPIERDMLIRIDSFKFCNNFPLKQSVSTGGYEVEVRLVMESQDTTFFRYQTGDRGANQFDLKGYLYLQPLLEGQIPSAFSIDKLFSRNTLIESLLYCQKVTECEGYYYQQFIEANPDRSKQQNRMMEGWNFAEYLNERAKP